MATWAEVEAKPEYQKLPPEQKDAARAQYFDQVVAPKVPKEQLEAARSQFDQQTAQKKEPTWGAKIDETGKAFDKAAGPGMAGIGRTAVAAGEDVLAMGSGIAGDVAGAVTSLVTQNPQRGEAVKQALTTQPATEAGQAGQKYLGALVQPVSKLFAKPVEALEKRGHPIVAQSVRAIEDVAPIKVPKIGRAASAAGAVADDVAATHAADYVSKNTSLDWNALPKDFKDRLHEIAKDPKALERLDPKMVERQGRLETLGIPATRGQVKRDLSELTKEEDLTKKPGSPVAQINAAQDQRLHELVDTLRKETGAKASTRQGLGKSVQDDALRAKAEVSKKNYDQLYATARATEPNATTSPAPLYDYLEKNPEVQHLGFMQSWLNKAKIKTVGEPAQALDVKSTVADALKAKGKPKGDEVQIRDVPLTELEDLRKKAAGIAMKGGDNAYYAGQVVKAIDKAFDNIPEGAKAWRAARDAFKAHKREFEDQGSVEKLVGQKSRTDRKTALEDTFDTFKRGSAEDIVKLRKSLLEGGNEATRAAGAQAWKDLQGATLDHLKAEAAGKRAIEGERSQLQFNAKFRDAFSELDKDGKIDVIFNPSQAKLLRDIYAAVGDVRTKPTGRIHGSDTASRLVSQLDKVAMIPYVGKYAAGAAKVLGKVSEMGADARANARAKRTPIDEAAAASKAKRAAAKKKQRRANTLMSIRRIAPVVAQPTLQDRERDTDRNPP